MRVFRYEPWSLLEQFRNEINRLSDNRDHSNGSSPIATAAVDIVENNDAYTLLADIPGVDPDAIDIHMENGVLSVKGERNPGTAEREAYKKTERTSGSFYRRFSLPETADANGVSATCRNGVLEITIPKQQKTQARKIAVAS